MATIINGQISHSIDNTQLDPTIKPLVDFFTMSKEKFTAWLNNVNAKAVPISQLIKEYNEDNRIIEK